MGKKRRRMNKNKFSSKFAYFWKSKGEPAQEEAPAAPPEEAPEVLEAPAEEAEAPEAEAAPKKKAAPKRKKKSDDA